MAHILVIDDIPQMAELIQEHLHEMGHSSDICKNGYDAFFVLKDGQYDLVITDIVMPRQDGLEFSRQVREKLTGKTQAIPILAMSGGAHSITDDLALMAAKTYTNAVMKKPFTHEQLQTVVENLLSAQGT